MLTAAGADSVKVVALLDKKGRRRVEFFPDYVGWEVSSCCHCPVSCSNRTSQALKCSATCTEGLCVDYILCVDYMQWSGMLGLAIQLPELAVTP